MNQILPVSFVVKLAARMYKANHRHYVNIKRGPPALSLSNYESRAEPSVFATKCIFLVGEARAQKACTCQA